MEQGEIMTLFRAHKRTVAREAYLRERIALLSESIEDMRRTALEDGIHTTQQLTGMPRSGRLSNPVENLAVMLADGDDPPHIKAMAHELRQLQRERRELLFDIRTVEALLTGLQERERFIIEKNLIDGLTWAQLIDCFEGRYGFHMSVEGLRRARKAAIATLCIIAS